MRRDDFPSLMTAAEAADFLGVPAEDVADWLREGKLRVAAWTEGGGPLVYRWRVEREGVLLAASVPIRFVKNPRGRTPRTRERLLWNPRALACGCSFAGTEGEAARQPIFLCRDGRALDAAARFAAMLAAAAPGDAFMARLAKITGDALEGHFAKGGSGEAKSEDVRALPSRQEPAGREPEPLVPRRLPAPAKEDGVNVF